jgi:post-segregation antitoxin (ccd killing protein)
MSRDFEQQGRELGRAVARLKRSYRAQRIPAPIRQRVVAFTLRARAAGVSWSALTEATGLTENTLKRWLATKARLVPVEISEAATTASTSANAKKSMTLVLPGGVRLEGVGIAEAVELARALR